jgi:hypothetical protein
MRYGHSSTHFHFRDALNIFLTATVPGGALIWGMALLSCPSFRHGIIIGWILSLIATHGRPFGGPNSVIVAD